MDSLVNLRDEMFFADDETVVGKPGEKISAPPLRFTRLGKSESSDGDSDQNSVTGEEAKADLVGNSSEQATRVSRRDSYLKAAPVSVQNDLPAVSSRVEKSVVTPEAGVLLITTYAPERNVFRTYLREHEISCRAAISPEHGLQLALEMRPSAILFSGSQLGPEEILTLLDDLGDLTNAPVMLLVSEVQQRHLRQERLAAHILRYPASLREIREKLFEILASEANVRPQSALRETHRQS